MVKLPEDESYVPLPMPRDLLAKYQRNRNISNSGPFRLVDLEESADAAADFIRTISKNYPNARQNAMNRLRQLYNLEFKLRCHVCGMAHYQDEITAPER